MLIFDTYAALLFTLSCCITETNPVESEILPSVRSFLELLCAFFAFTFKS